MSFLLSNASAEVHKFMESPYARVPKELGCAFTASFLVSPLVSIIDKAIVQEVVGIMPLMISMGGACQEMILKPRTFFGGLSFRLTFAVYFGTYAVANLSEAALDYKQVRQEQTRKVYKVSAASAANIGLLAWRDSVFARVFSGDNAKVPAKTPMRTIGLFAARDSATMAATFYAAPLASKYLVEHHGWEKNRADVTCSLSIPVLAQFITAPLHIHALDYFMKPTGVTTADRWNTIRLEMGKVCFARGLRVLPAFGIGSFSNNKFRELTIKQWGGQMTLGEKLTRRVTILEERFIKGHSRQEAIQNADAVLRRRTTSMEDAYRATHPEVKSFKTTD